MIAIRNIQEYNKKMAKGMKDKLWFTQFEEMSDVEVFLDYGCADGSLLEHLSELYPNAFFIGCENNYQQRLLAITRLKNKTNIRICANIDESVLEVLKLLFPGNKWAIILSSVYHEFQSKPIAEFNSINNELFRYGADYILIRDMGTNWDEAWVSPTYKDIGLVKLHSDGDKLKEFEDKWGSIVQYSSNFIHYLLKTQYSENWKRELEEEYIVDVDQMHLEYHHTYEQKYLKHYILPYFKEYVRSSFGIELEFNTHFNLFLKRKTND